MHDSQNAEFGRAAAPAARAFPRAVADVASELSVVRITIALLRARRLIVGLALVAFLAVAGFGLLAPRRFTSSTTILPQAQRVPNLSGFAAQLGLNLTGNDPGSSPAFYVELLHSRIILAGIADSAVTVTATPAVPPVRLDEFFRIGSESPAKRRDQTIRKLLAASEVSSSRQTGTVRLRVTTRDAMMSQAIIYRYLALLEEFNLETRQSRARAERRFAEERLRLMREELKAAELQHRHFLERNRDSRGSPMLMFEQDRLAREVSMKQQLVNSLAQSYEQARIDEVRDVPLFTVVEPPDAPALPDSRGLLAKGVGALVLGAAAGMLISFLRLLFASTGSEDEPGLEELSQLRQAVRLELRYPWLMLRQRSR